MFRNNHRETYFCIPNEVFTTGITGITILTTIIILFFDLNKNVKETKKIEYSNLVKDTSN